MPHRKGGDLKRRETTILIACVMAAGAARVATLWIGKPEFAGWFNHVYYYFVQVRGLMNSGRLPYPDMPLLFYLDRAVAGILSIAGMPVDDAVVAATRTVMCLIGAAMPVPVYFLLREMNDDRPLRAAQWVLVALSGFLPLTVNHIPEMLQKNMAGMLFLTWLMLFSLRLLKHGGIGNAIRCGIVALLIVLTHFGTTAAMAILAFSTFLASAIVSAAPRRLIGPAALASAGGAAIAALIFAMDPHRFFRILRYLSESLGNSLLMTPFTPGAGGGDILAAMAVIGVILALAATLVAFYRRHRAWVPDGEDIFWLANICFTVGLILPVVDQHLMGRLALFMSLPLLVNIAYMERHVVRQVWMRRIGVAAAALLLGAMAVGETVSAAIHNANHRAVYADLSALRERQAFQPDDLIIARTGVEHLSNWFFGTRVGVLTTLTLDDFSSGRRVFVLNPLDGVAASEPGTVRGEADVYRVMRANVPLPDSARPLFRTDNLAFYELAVPPREWLFDRQGAWRGYRP